MNQKKTVKFGRLALVIFVGILLGLVSMIYIKMNYGDLDVPFSLNQMYFFLALLVVLYVLYLKLATQTIGDNLHKEKEKLHRIVECIPNPTLLINPEGQITFFNTKAGEELKLDISQHTLCLATEVFECPEPNPFSKSFSGHAQGFCKPLGHNVEIIVDSHKSATGSEKIVLAQPLSERETQSATDSSTHFDTLVSALESDASKTDLILFCLNAKRNVWQRQMLEGTITSVSGNSSVNTAVAVAEKSLSAVISTKRVTIVNHLEGDLSIKLDQKHLNEIIEEVFANALAQTKETGGEIKIEGQEDNGSVKLQITDTGKGLNPSSISQLWDKGYVGQGHTNPFDKAPGLGLPALKKCLEQIDGDAFIEGAPDKGCRVTFRF